MAMKQLYERRVRGIVFVAIALKLTMVRVSASADAPR